MKHSKTYIAIPPGATIKETIDDRNMQQKELAIRLGISEKHLSKLIAGKVELTTDMASKLESVLGMPASFWLGLETDYRLDLRKVDEENLQEEEKNFVKKFHYALLCKAGYVPKTKKITEKILYLKSFFEVASLNTLFDQKFNNTVAFRKLKKTEKSDILALAWCQKAKIEARKQELGKLDLIKKMPSHMPELRRLIASDTPNLVGAQEILNDCGIALVTLPQLDGSGIHGASFAVGNTVVMALSDRRKTADVFSFSFFHELGHVMHGHFYRCGELTDKDEKQADEFASEQLIPSKGYNDFVEKGDFSKQSICDFAKQEGISTGIVIGRLQKEEKIPYTQFNDLKFDFTF